MGIFGSILSFLGCKNSDINATAKQIKISALHSELRLLEAGKTEYEFIGITSNGIDCIYFIKENNKYNIEFEAMDKQQIEIIPELEEFARKNHFEVQQLNYGNKPNYPSRDFAPVLKIVTKAELDEIFKIGKKIQKEIFQNDDETIYDIVP